VLEEREVSTDGFRGIGATRLCCGWLDYLRAPLMADWPSAPGICAIMPGWCALLVRSPCRLARAPLASLAKCDLARGGASCAAVGW
jgi:hypothetical protein